MKSKKAKRYFITGWYNGSFNQSGYVIIYQSRRTSIPYKHIAYFPFGQLKLARKVLKDLENKH